MAKVAAANVHGNSKFLATKRTSGGTPSGAFTSTGTFPSPRPPPGSSMPSSPSPRSPNVPPATRYSLERWEDQHPLLSAAAAGVAAAASESGRHQDLRSASLAPSTLTGLTTMSSQRELKDYPPSDACPTNTKSSISVDSWHGSCDSTVTVPTRTGAGELQSYQSSESRLAPQSALFSLDLSMAHQQQRQQQRKVQAVADTIGGGIAPLGRVDGGVLQCHHSESRHVPQSAPFPPDLSMSHQQHRQQQRQAQTIVDATTIGGRIASPGREDVSYRPPSSDVSPGNCYSTEQQRRQLWEQQLLQPARPAAGRGATTASDRGVCSSMQRLGDTMQRLGGPATSPFSQTAPLIMSPQRKPVQQQQKCSQPQHLSIIKSQMGHPQRQHNWRVLASSAEETVLPPAHERRGHDDVDMLRRSASPRMRRNPDLCPQQQHAVAAPSSLLQPSLRSPSLSDPLALMASASMALAAASPRSKPFSSPRGVVMAARSTKPPPIAIEGISIVVEAGSDTRGGHPQPKALREPGASNATVASAPPKIVAAPPVGEAGVDNGETDPARNKHCEGMNVSKQNPKSRTVGDVSSRATGLSTRQHQQHQGQDVQHVQQEGRGGASWSRVVALDLDAHEIKSGLIANAGGDGKNTSSAEKGLGLVGRQEKIQPRPPWRQTPSSTLVAQGDHPPRARNRFPNAGPSPENVVLPPEVKERAKSVVRTEGENVLRSHLGDPSSVLFFLGRACKEQATSTVEDSFLKCVSPLSSSAMNTNRTFATAQRHWIMLHFQVIFVRCTKI